MAQPADREPLPVTFRRMSFLDVGSVHAIENASFPLPWRRRTFLTRLLLSDHYGYVAEVEGKIVGYVFFRIAMGGAHLQKIAVTKECRRRGIGARLMEVMLEQAAAQGAETVYLEVRLSNRTAQEFYKKFHFTLHHVEHSYYADNGESAQILVREVRQEPDPKT